MVPGEFDGEARMFPDLEAFEHFAWVKDAIGVEGMLDGPHGGDLGGVVLEGEEGSLGEANAVFA